MSSRKIDSYSNHTGNRIYNLQRDTPASDPINNVTNSQPVQPQVQPEDRSITQALSFFGDMLPIVVKIWKCLLRLMESLAAESIDDGQIEYGDLIPKNSREYLALRSYRDIEHGRDQQFTAEIYKSLKREKKKRGIF